MLQLVLGRTGSGKTEYVFNSIKQEIEQGNENILLITPEQYSFISEGRLLKELGESNVNKVDNASFSRLIDIITKIYGGFDLPILSKGSKAVMFKKTCEKCSNELYLFEKNTSSNTFINSAIRIYDEMKSCRVSSQDIMEASNNTQKDILSKKLHDISVIMDTYDKLIDGKYIDCANELTFLYEKLLNLDYFTNKTIYIDGFNGFVAQEYKIIEVILKQAKNVYITFCTDSFSNDNKYDLFSYVNSNLSILTSVAKKSGIDIAQPIVLENNYRFNNDELLNIEKYCFKAVKNTFDNTPQNIILYEAKSVIDECDNVASNISKLLRAGVNASDIAVICRDLNKYKRELQFSFLKYNIPYYNDERQVISSQPLIMFVNFLLRVSMYSFKSEDVLSLLKTGLTSLESDKVCEFENYIYLWNITGPKLKCDFVNSTKGFVESISESDKKQLDSINETRKYIIDNLEKFVRASKNKNAKDISKAIYYCIKDLSVDEGIINLAKSLDENGKSVLASELGRVWDMLMDILDKLALVGGDEEISVKEYSKLFNLMIANEDIGSIPAGLNNVQLGSADRIRCDNPYAVFVIGANDGEFPRNLISGGLLTEADRVTLIENDFKLYSYGETLNAQEKYFAYMALCCARNKLFVSYSNGYDSNPSEIISSIKEIYPNIKTYYNNDYSILAIETEKNAFSILASNYDDDSDYITTLKEYFSNKEEYKNRIAAINGLVNNEDIEIKDKELSTSLFDKDMYLSASRIEKYYNCAFMYYCKYGIRANPRKKAQMDPMQTGTVIHYVLECLIKEVGSKGLLELDESSIKEYVDKYLLKYLNSKMGDSNEFTTRFKYQFTRLSKMLLCIVLRLKEEFSISDFEARAFELTIGDGRKNEDVISQVISLNDGGSIRINGAIDRVDTYEENGEQFVRVVDYKSGTKTFQLSDIINGLNLQMFIYLFMLCKNGGELSGTGAGVLYMHSDRNIYSIERNNTTKSLASENNDYYKMMGVVLNDETHNIAEHMDREMSNNFVPVKCSSKGVISGNIVSLEDLGRLSRKIDELITEMGVKLHNGEINPNPANGKHHDHTCEYCDYRDVCINRKEIIPRELEELAFDDVLSKLKEDEEHA